MRAEKWVEFIQNTDADKRTIESQLPPIKIIGHSREEAIDDDETGLPQGFYL